MEAKAFVERDLVTACSDDLLRTVGLEVIDREVQIGKFKLDAVALDGAGDLVVVEFKTDAHIRALAQLLLYPHALHKLLRKQGVEVIPPIRSVLISTNVDFNVVEVAQEVSGFRSVEVFLCTGQTGAIELVKAGVDICEARPDLSNTIWDQATVRRARLGKVIAALHREPKGMR